MSDTPRTDAWLKDYYETYGSPPGVPSTLDWAQKLEREVAELRKALQNCMSIMDSLRDFVCEGGSIRMVGAREAVSEADATYEIARAALKGKP